MSVTFTKLFTSITESTVWFEPDSTRLVWITMLAMADRKGRVFASTTGLAHRARVSEEQCEEALRCFLSPDTKSRTKEHEGRRIAEVDGGWVLLNHAKYRAIRDEEVIKETKRNSIARKRAETRNVENVDRCRPQSTAVEPGRHNAEAEAEAEADPEADPDLFGTPLPPKGGALKSKAEPIDYQAFVDEWNRCVKGTPFSSVAALTDKRKSDIRAVVNTMPDFQSRIEAIVKRHAANEFSCGKNEREWRFNFDFMIRPSKAPGEYEACNTNQHKPTETDYLEMFKPRAKKWDETEAERAHRENEEYMYEQILLQEAERKANAVQRINP